MNDYYFDGDPEVDSTRRQLERVLQGRPRRRWPWVVAALAGGTALTVWRIRARGPKPAKATEAAPSEPASRVEHG